MCDYENTNEESLNMHISSEHVEKCDDCDLIFINKPDLEGHVSSCHDKNKTSNSAVSCLSCDPVKKENVKLKEQLSMTKTAYDETKSSYENTLKDLQEKLENVLDLRSEVSKLKGELAQKDNQPPSNDEALLKYKKRLR